MVTGAKLSPKPKQFKTTLRHRKLGPLLRVDRERPPGQRKAPEVLALEGTAPGDRPNVRIFLGTEPRQYRAERIFVWSILQQRDPSRTYEIHFMKDIEGFDRSGWKTGFTNYRYAIPSFAGGQGRAIFNDVDEIYLADPAELFDTDMAGAGVLGINERETSVMLIDCAAMGEVWRRADAQSGHRHRHFRAAMHDNGLWGRLAGEWNARDSEFVEGRSKLLHYTTLQTQPWQPFPELLKYQPEPSPEAWVWFEMERAADAAGFTIYSEDRPSRRYGELADQYRIMHERGAVAQGKSPEETFGGKSMRRHIEPIARLIRETGARTILDFGAGKGRFYASDPDAGPGARIKSMPGWPGARITCYDPGYEPFSGPYDDAYDGVITVDVVEHIPEEDIPWVLRHLFTHAGRFVYVVAACYPARKTLPNGENAHCTVLPPAWWQTQMDMASRFNPQLRWVLCTIEKGRLGVRLRRFAGGEAAALAGVA
jgi:hypothetical protein